MKKIFCLITLLFVSHLSFAANEISSFRTSTGQQVIVGDSLNQLISKTAQSPSMMKSTTWLHTDQKLSAMIYDYEIDQTIYSVTVVQDQVRKIESQQKAF